MIVYSATKTGFQDDIMSNNIGQIILDKFRDTTGKSTGVSEMSSWTNSLQFMDRVLNDESIPADSNISIEYHIPRTSNRIDFIITGLNLEKEESVIVMTTGRAGSLGKAPGRG